MKSALLQNDVSWDGILAANSNSIRMYFKIRPHCLRCKTLLGSLSVGLKALKGIGFASMNFCEMNMLVLEHLRGVGMRRLLSVAAVQNAVVFRIHWWIKTLLRMFSLTSI